MCNRSGNWDFTKDTVCVRLMIGGHGTGIQVHFYAQCTFHCLLAMPLGCDSSSYYQHEWTASVIERGELLALH